MNEPLEFHADSSFYWRRAFQQCSSFEDAIALGLHLVKELECHKQQLRDAGIEPLCTHVTPEEVEARGWEDEVVEEKPPAETALYEAAEQKGPTS